MKKYFFITAAAALIMGCAATGRKAVLVSTIPAMYTAQHLADCTIPAAFTADSFDWKDGSLRLSVFYETRYRAADIAALAKGDTLVYEGRKMVVDTIASENGELSINGGLEQGGAWLMKDRDGNYRATQMDGHSVYVEAGQARLPLAPHFVIVDCGENPTDPYDTVSSAQRQWVHNLEGYKRNFGCLDTRVKIVNGTIQSITRHWIP